MPTLICVPIMVEDPEAALRDAAASRDAGADLVEYRVDPFFTGSGEEYEQKQIVDLVTQSPLPCIVTCRPTSEGGQYDGDDMARIALFERLGTAFGKDEHPPRYIDIELATYARSANLRQKVNLAVAHPEQIRDVQTSLILSIHDFHSRPADLSRLLLKLRQEPAARIHKIAWRARSIRDNIELFDILSHRDRPTIAIGMGEFGLMSRILAPKFGGFLTFASLRPRDATAPGQPTIHELLHLYRFRSINPRTATYGLIGYPIGHSLSPHVHNAGFEAVGHDGVYVPLRVVGSSADDSGGYESLKATLGELFDYAPLNFRGASITIPHKEHIVRLGREQGWKLDETSAATGAANTITIDRDEASGAVTHIRLSNTDAPALVDALTPALGNPAGKQIVILGAGGAARAAAHALLLLGASVTISNRTPARADALVAAFKSAGPGAINALDPGSLSQWDACINCTPIGMRGGPDPDALPLPREALDRANPGAVVMDTVYNPVETPLLRTARDTGLKTVDAITMFVTQAAAQFTQWTGHPAPVALFERIARRELDATQP